MCRTTRSVIISAMVALSMPIHTLHCLNLEQFTEDMMEYFGAEDPVVLFDPLAVSTPLALGVTTSFIVIEYDLEEPKVEADINKVANFNSFSYSCKIVP